jgi:hypothetical protein
MKILDLLGLQCQDKYHVFTKRGEQVALTDLQIPTKENFYANLRTAATRMNALMVQWAEMAEFLNAMETADLDAMSIPAGQVRTDIVDFRIAVEELVGFFEGTYATAPTNTPETIINKIRNMTVRG